MTRLTINGMIAKEELTESIRKGGPGSGRRPGGGKSSPKTDEQQQKDDAVRAMLTPPTAAEIQHHIALGEQTTKPTGGKVDQRRRDAETMRQRGQMMTRHANESHDLFNKHMREADNLTYDMDKGKIPEGEFNKRYQDMALRHLHENLQLHERHRGERAKAE